MGSPSAGAAPRELSASRVAVLLGTLVALTVIGSSAVAVALPEVAADLGLDKPGTAWVLAVFSLSFSVATAVFGRVADLRGLRLPLAVGTALLALGSIGAAAAWNFPSLIVARLVQGTGAGAVPVLALGILAARFQGPARSRALGALTAVVSIVSGSGPLIGGGIAELLGWRFVLAIPTLAVLIVVPVAGMAPATAVVAGRIDWRGAALVTAVTTGVVLLLQSPATQAGPVVVGLAVALTMAGGAGLVGHVRSKPEGFLPLRVVGNRDVMLTCVAGLTLLAAYLGMMLAVPLIFADDQGWRPLQIGLAMLPAALTGAVVSRLVGGAAERVGRYRIALGLCVGSAAGLVLAGVGHHQPVLLVLGLAGAVAGFGGGQTALIDAIPDLVAEDVRGVAIGVFNLIFFTGGAVGAAAVGGLGGAFSLPVAVACLAALPAGGALACAVVGRRRAASSGDAEADHYRARHGLHHQA